MPSTATVGMAVCSACCSTDADSRFGEGAKPRRGESWAGVTIQVPNWSSFCTARTASHGLPRRTVMRKGRSTAPGQGAHQFDHRC